MSQDNGDTIRIDKKTPLKMNFATLFAIVAGSVGVTGTVLHELNLIRDDLRAYHQDCQKNFDQSWHIADQVEWKHQTTERNGQMPDVSEVLRKTRSSARAGDDDYFQN